MNKIISRVPVDQDHSSTPSQAKRYCDIHGEWFYQHLLRLSKAVSHHLRFMLNVRFRTSAYLFVRLNMLYHSTRLSTAAENIPCEAVHFSRCSLPFKLHLIKS